jgi:hypothetical protein
LINLPLLNKKREASSWPRTKLNAEMASGPFTTALAEISPDNKKYGFLVI